MPGKIDSSEEHRTDRWLFWATVAITLVAVELFS